jgi:four helix bundle protein
MSQDPRMRAFRAADAFAMEIYRLAASLSSNAPRSLVDAIRLSAMHCGGALVAASADELGCEAERLQLSRARRELLEGRYYLSLARRLGLIDSRRYRAVVSRQDAAFKELDGLLARRP